MDADTHTELAVVGGGPGGYAAAIRAAQLGVETTLVERDALGGVCLNTGCIPSKALISAADLVHRASHAEPMGIHADPTVDEAAFAEWRADVTAGMSRAVEKLCRANGVEVVEGSARFADAETLVVDEAAADADGNDPPETTLAFDDAIVAVGSRPVELSGLSYDRPGVLDAADVLGLESLPDRLVVVGAGYVGMELATALAKLGTDVVVCEALDAMLPGFDDELVRPVRKRARELGIDVHLETAVTDVETGDDGTSVAVHAEDADGAAVAFEGDAVLVAVGRAPAADRVGPDAAGLAVDDEGFIETDERGRTTTEGIYAVGDVSGEPLLAHAASHEGVLAAATVAGAPDAAPPVGGPVPAVAFTDPEVATVGLASEAVAAEAGVDPLTGEFPFRASGRAATAGDTEGFLRVVAEAGTGVLRGGAVVGAEASEVIAELTLAVQTGATVADVAGTVHAHPTFAEAAMEAAENAEGRAIHTLNR